MINTAAATRVALFVLLAALLPGCVYSGGSSDVTLTFSSNVPKDQRLDGAASCDDQGELTVAFAGLRTGSVQVRVFDGDGATIFDETYLGGEGGDTARSLFGTPGTWTLELVGRLAEGKATVRLSC